MFDIFISIMLLTGVCFLVGAVLVAALSYKHEGIDDECYGPKHSRF
jgi:hypothetical protein